uniref:C-X-C chemokine receptor type 1-like n=1 Tax=Lepisosteus oculatus TaxID=7918 RepID=W5MS42_LEPOC|nr:PREDICTED: C-X-C chemokine receptor type 1-like isoform X1 [Lepisosteus oculatus]
MDGQDTALRLNFEDLYILFNFSDYENLSGNSTGTFLIDQNTIICQGPHFEPAVNSAICVVYFLIFLLAIPGNIIVALVIGYNYRFLSPSDIYLLHLVVADTLYALSIPFWAVSTVHGWVFGDVMCKLVSLIQEVNFYSSILFLMCISIDRYLAIVWAVKAHRKRRALCSWMVCFSVWVLGTVFSFPVLFNDAFKPVNSDRIVCYEYHNPESIDQWKLGTRVLRHVLGFLLPLIVMLVCYGVTISRLLGTRSFEKQKAMRVIVAVVIAFLLCWMPYHLSVISDTIIRSGLISYSCETRNSIDLALFFTQSLGLLHSCINPVLYAFVGQKFRRNLLNLLYKTRVLERSSLSRSSRSTSQTSEGTSTFL